MPSSGTVTFSVSRDQILIDALQSLGVMRPSDTTSSTSFTNNSVMAATSLNMLIKQISGRQDWAEQLWEYKRAYLFLSASANTYNIGPTSGNRWVSGFTSTTLTANANANATALTVASITGISASDQLAVQLDSGVLFWTTVSGAPSGSTVTAAAGITTAATSGNRVYAYTASSKLARRPINIISAVLRDVNNNDVPLGIFETIDEWMNLPNKTQAVDNAQYFYEPQLTDGVLYVDGYASDVTKQIYAVFQSPVEDVAITSTSSETLDVTQQCYRYLSHGLAWELWPKFPTPERRDAIKELRDEAYAVMSTYYPEKSTASFQPHAPQ